MATPSPSDPATCTDTVAPAEDIDLRLLPAFLAEAAIRLPVIGEGLAGLANKTPDSARVRRLAHELHSLKGTAHMVGATHLAGLVHASELRLRQWQQQPDLPVPDLAEVQAALSDQVAALNELAERHGYAPATDPDEGAPVPITVLEPRLRRVLDQAAQALGKQAELHVVANDVRFERTRVEGLLPALEPLVRNAVAHGIEVPPLRAAAGKPERGRVTLETVQRSEACVVIVSDDGAGVDIAAAERRAATLGLAPGAALEDWLCHPGLSTAGRVDMIAGLGVGLDAVRAVLAELGGRFSLESEAGSGTRCYLRLPL